MQQPFSHQPRVLVAGETRLLHRLLLRVPKATLDINWGRTGRPSFGRFWVSN